MSRLYDTLKIGRMELSQRIAMAPMTRMRADTNHVPLASVKEYYKQRAAVPGSLLITEATIISPRFGGYSNVPGIYNDAQIAAWKEVTQAVHEKGSYIYMQLWALGRAGNPGYLQQHGFDLLSSSDVPMKSAFSDETHYPRPATEAEIQGAIADFASAARNAIDAGFDGVEIHGANGYLIDQFIQDVTNRRTDRWGGSIENRSRLADEVVRAVVEAVGNDRTAIRLSPWGTYQGMRMEDPVPQFTDVVKKLAKYKLAYLHACESDAKANGDHLQWLLDAYRDASPVIVAGNYTPESAKKAVDEEYAGRDVAIAFGRPYISNPDLPFRVKEGIPFEQMDPSSLYAQTPKGYTDYAFSKAFENIQVAA